MTLIPTRYTRICSYAYILPKSRPLRLDSPEPDPYRYNVRAKLAFKQISLRLTSIACLCIYSVCIVQRPSDESNSR